MKLFPSPGQLRPNGAAGKLSYKVSNTQRKTLQSAEQTQQAVPQSTLSLVLINASQVISHLFLKISHLR